MKKIKTLFLTSAVMLAAVSFTGCVRIPLIGGVYTSIKDGMVVTSNAGSSKVGTAMAKSILGVVATGDASIQAAAKAGGISRIHHVDYESKSILGVYSTYTVIVYGE